MNTAIVSAHMFVSGMEHDIEIFEILHDDEKGTGIFDDIEKAILDQIEPTYDSSGSYFLIAFVKSNFVEHRNWEGIEYDVEHEVTEINNVAQLHLVPQ